MFMASSTPNQIRLMSRLLGHRRQQRDHDERDLEEVDEHAQDEHQQVHEQQEAHLAARQLVEQVLDPDVAVGRVEGEAEHRRADQDEQHEDRQLGAVFQRLLEQLECSGCGGQPAMISAPSAPMAPPSVGVAMPRKMVPSTRKISTSGGISTKVTCSASGQQAQAQQAVEQARPSARKEPTVIDMMTTRRRRGAFRDRSSG
jgi:hypothetical protein